MGLAFPLLALVVVVIAIWVIIEVKRFKHKIFAFFLIFLIVGAYFSLALSTRGEDVDLKSASGLLKLGKVYFSWLGGFFSNAKQITTYAIDLNWKEENKTTES